MNRSRLAHTSAVVLSASLLLGGCTSGDGEGPETASSATPAPASGSGPQSPAAASVDIPQVVRDVEPSVVTIFTDGGLGSGVVYREDGTIITNQHVVGDARTVEVAFADGQRSSATVVASDVATDLAVIRADRTGLPPAQFQEDLPEVGSLAIALGSPLGFENTVTAGIISGIGRAIPGSAQLGAALVDLLQTDAAISPGNSGGALVNGAGEVIGINDAYLPPSTGAVSIGFAIPTGTVVDVVEQLLATGTVQRPSIGVSVGRVTPELAQQFDLQTAAGALVLQVQPGGPGDEAGIQSGDLITTVADERVDSVEELLGALRRLDIGQTVSVEVLREGASRTLQVTLADVGR